MKYLTRNKVYHKVDASKDAKKIYIFCEGEKREIQYFKYFEGLVTNIEIIPIANKDGLSDPVKLMEDARDLFLSETPKLFLSGIQKDEIWFVIDTDRWNENNKIDILKAFCHDQNIKDTAWFIAQSNPCFEIWLYYHFYDQLPDKDAIALCTSFKHFVATKIVGGFDNRSMPVEIEKATQHAMKNYLAEDKGQPVYLATELFRLGMVLLPYIKDQLNIILGAMAAK